MNTKLDRDDTLLLVVDVQVRLAAAMVPEAMQRVAHAAQVLVRGAALLGVPVLVTEQYPKGLGRTLPEVLEALPPDARTFEKTAFSCASAAEVRQAIESTGRQSVILCGMETHVCVYQTARDLAGMGYRVFVARDAVLSRTEENLHTGLDLMQRAGAAVTCTETALFDMLGDAAHPEFKAISALVK